MRTQKKGAALNKQTQAKGKRALANKAPSKTKTLKSGRLINLYQRTKQAKTKQTKTKQANKLKSIDSLDLRTWDSNQFTKPVSGLANDYVFIVTATSGKKLEWSLASKEATSQRPLIFASLITSNDNKNNTFGNCGLILGIKPSSVVATSRRDTMLTINDSNFKYSTLKKEIQSITSNYNRINGSAPHPKNHENSIPRHIPDSPDSLLAQMKKTLKKPGRPGFYKHNEIILTGTSLKGDKTNPIGFFIKVKDGKDMASSKDVKKLEETAKKWGVPLVRIPHTPGSPAMMQ